MGSAKAEKASTKPQISEKMAEEKKSILSALKKALKWPKKSKRDKNDKAPVIEEKAPQPPKVTSVAVLLEQHEKKKKAAAEVDDEEDEFKNFKTTIIEDVPRTARLDSHRSDESGFTEMVSDDEKDPVDKDKVNEDKVEELVEGLKDLSVEKKDTKDTKEKTRKLCTVAVPRGPTHQKHHGAAFNPYPVSDYIDSGYRQGESHINPRMLSGGQVTVNANTLTSFPTPSPTFDLENQSTEIEDTLKNIPLPELCNDLKQLVAELLEDNSLNDLDNNIYGIDNNQTLNIQSPDYFSNNEVPTQSNSYLTPPYSGGLSSPVSDQSGSWSPNFPNMGYPGYSSPQDSSPMNLPDLEQFQDLQESDDIASFVDTQTNDRNIKKIQFKHMNNKLTEYFSKKECCQTKRRTCIEILKDHANKLKVEVRNKICWDVSELDIGKAHIVLFHILKDLSWSNEDEDFKIFHFSLICEKMVAQEPKLFLGSVGLTLINVAALQCSNRPLITRYLVQCIRLAARTRQETDPEKPIFHGVNASDNPVHGCAEAGDGHAAALSELVRREPHDPPLFDVHQTNQDGFPPLHVASSAHSRTCPRYRTAHVLLKHAGAQLRSMELKGGDTALHLAVNSPNCDLLFILTLFNHIEYKEWINYKSMVNRSQMSALQLARSASRTRPNFPIEVLEFFMKISR